MARIYLDNNATTRTAPEVADAISPYLGEIYGNPSSVHRMGARAASALKEAREKTAAFLKCRESEVVFTSGGTESNNMAIHGVLRAAPEKKHIVTSTVEHPSVLEVYKHLEGAGYRATYVGVDREGTLDLQALEDSISEDTALVSLMYANNETGVVFPVEDIVNIVEPRGVPLHVDAVQAAGKIPLDMSSSRIDLLSLSGHKLHAPKGVGVLFVRRGTRIRPLLIGGGQEKGRRSGTENIPFIVGFGKALELAAACPEVVQMRRLRDKLEETALSSISTAVRNGAAEHRLPNTSNLSFEGLEGEAILLMMDEAGICASSGSACSTGALEPSHVLSAMGVPASLARGSVRFSLSRYTTEAEIDAVINELPRIVKRLSALSNKTNPTAIRERHG
ncbi:MAG: cysteine desulfurase NifS [Candidatus Latescibacterota bacterium]|nr:MAG: cysteine desulfurase NifS [Candidatus Latescibacterota bacterium]